MNTSPPIAATEKFLAGYNCAQAVLCSVSDDIGMDKDTALAANLLWRAATFIPQVVIGIVTFIIWRVQQSRKAGRNVVAGGTAPVA